MNWWSMDFEQKIIMVAFVLSVINALAACGLLK
jgi:hypothetical protein